MKFLNFNSSTSGAPHCITKYSKTQSHKYIYSNVKLNY